MRPFLRRSPHPRKRQERHKCCGGTCFDPFDQECCDERTVCDTLDEKCCNGECLEKTHDDDTCCPDPRGHGGVLCQNIDECCDGHCCDALGSENCCGGVCVKRESHESECCEKAKKFYDSDTHECCGDDVVPKGECCGGQRLGKGEECCHSGKLAYPAPKGHCCGHGQHRVTCQTGGTFGEGKDICCPEDQHCCGGKCCRPEDCHDGKCQPSEPKKECKIPGYPKSYTACRTLCCGGKTPVCCKGANGTDQCCDPHTEMCCPGLGCIHPGNAEGQVCPGNCSFPANITVGCCPSGSAGACGASPGESHGGCQGGYFGCFCTGGEFCPYAGPNSAVCQSDGSCRNVAA